MASRNDELGLRMRAIKDRLQWIHVQLSENLLLDDCATTQSFNRVFARRVALHTEKLKLTEEFRKLKEQSNIIFSGKSLHK